MSRHDDRADQLIPAHLDLFSIYSPALGLSEEKEKDQIVFYYSDGSDIESKTHRQDEQSDRGREEEENEQLRQVGLAQGIVTFAKTFSNGENVETVETDKHRIVLTEIEKGWWILASIKFTSIPSSQSSEHQTTVPSNEAFVEYSSRDVSPPDLLLKQINRAYRIFLLHHGRTFSDIFLRMTRQRFCNLLEHFWRGFARSWEMFLHGNPVADLYGGIKLAGGGELGTGVGEEHYGSGEREYIQGLISRTDGLIDLTVSRFDGDREVDKSGGSSPSEHQQPNEESTESASWLGAGHLPRWGDGMIFTGMGAVSRPSLQAIWDWNLEIFLLGMSGYGVRENPTSRQRRQRRKGSQTDNTESEDADDSKKVQRPAESTRKSLPLRQTPTPRPNIPPPIVSALEGPSDAGAGSDKYSPTTRVTSTNDRSGESRAEDTESRPWMKYLTLGYNPSWSSISKTYTAKQGHMKGNGHVGEAQLRPNEISSEQQEQPQDPSFTETSSLQKQKARQTQGYFLIGLMKDLETNNTTDADASNDPLSNTWSGRLSVRTLRVRLNKAKVPSLPSKLEDPDEDPSNGAGPSKNWVDARLRVVIYVNNPFIFTFLFNPTTSALSLPSFYRSLHNSLQALQDPLKQSTSPSKATERLSSLLPPQPNSLQQIYSLTYDPSTMILHSTIPNIPKPQHPKHPSLQVSKRGFSPQKQTWTRAEALAAHNHMLATWTATRRQPGELERTAKTNRGWWITWLRVPPNSDANAERADEMDDDDNGPRSDTAEGCREAFLVRVGSEAVSGSSRSGSWGGAVARGLSASIGRGGDGPRDEDAGGAGRIALEGVGLDARKLVDGLLGLSW